MRLRSSRSLMRRASNCRDVCASDEGVALLHLLCCSGRPDHLIGCHITGASATNDGTDFPSKKRPEASFTAEKNTPYSDSLTAQFQGNLMRMFVIKKV